MRGGVFCGNFLKWMVVVRFANIGGIVDHYCLNFSFIIYLLRHLSPIKR
jgi:hypothetical protein